MKNPTGKLPAGATSFHPHLLSKCRPCGPAPARNRVRGCLRSLTLPAPSLSLSFIPRPPTSKKEKGKKKRGQPALILPASSTCSIIPSCHALHALLKVRKKNRVER